MRCSFQQVFTAGLSSQELAPRVYFLLYQNSLEEEKYISSVNRERQAFESLIREKQGMVLNVRFILKFKTCFARKYTIQKNLMMVLCRFADDKGYASSPSLCHFFRTDECKHEESWWCHQQSRPEKGHHCGH